MRVTFRSPVTLTFVLLATAMYFLFETDGTIPRFFVLRGTADYNDVSWYVSLLGYTLGHANISHLIGNLSIILLLGPMIEKRYGAKLTILMMALTAVITALIHILFWDSSLIGASGIVFMMIVISSLLDLQGNEIPFTFILIVLLFVGQEVMNSIKDDEISQFAHIAGGALGVVFGYYYKHRKA